MAPHPPNGEPNGRYWPQEEEDEVSYAEAYGNDHRALNVEDATASQQPADNAAAPTTVGASEEESKDEEGGRMTTSVSALSLSSAAEHQYKAAYNRDNGASLADLDPASGSTSMLLPSGVPLETVLSAATTTGHTSCGSSAASTAEESLPSPSRRLRQGSQKLEDPAPSSGSQRPLLPLPLMNKDGELGGDLEAASPSSGHDALCPPSPSNQSVVHSVVSTLWDDLLHLPRWQVRAMLGAIVFLFTSLVLLLILSCLYGFFLSFPHIKVIGVDLILPPPHLDAQGNVPLNTTLLLANSNSFPVRTKTGYVEIYADKAMTKKLGVAEVPPTKLHSHEEGHVSSFNFTMKDVMHLPGGTEIVQQFVKKGPSFFYTVSKIPIVVKGLGLIPMTRNLRVDCEILREWGGEGALLSDCASRFIS